MHMTSPSYDNVTVGSMSVVLYFPAKSSANIDREWKRYIHRHMYIPVLYYLTAYMHLHLYTLTHLKHTYMQYTI